jgi:hypothetical protein
VIETGDHPEKIIILAKIWLHTRYESRKEKTEFFYVLDYLLKLNVIIKRTWPFEKEIL